MKTGFHVGALAEIFINEKFSVQPELLYSTQGAKGGYTEEFGFGQYVNVDTKLSLDYITVPMMAKYYVMDGLSVQAGPQVAFLVKAEGEYTTMGKTETEDVKKELNGVEFGFNLGAGYELPMGLFFDARYNIGISNVDKKNDDYQIKAKNGVFQLSVGYKF